MSTHIVVIDDYHKGLIDSGAVVVYDPTVQPRSEESVAETKVVRRGRPPKPKANEDVETK